MVSEAADPGQPLPFEAYERLGVMPFQEFTPAKQAEINADCLEDVPPNKWASVTLAWMPSRAWFEWFVRRGRDPRLSREKIPPFMRADVARRDAMICQLCFESIASEAELHIDHIVPVSRGGRTVPRNLRATHAICNLRRGAKYDPAEERAR